MKYPNKKYITECIKLLFFILLFTIVYNIVSAQDDIPDSTAKIIEEPQLTPLQELQNDIDALLENPDLSNAVTGISVQSLETGEYFYRQNDTKNFIPASTLKLLTTAAALEYLGPEFRYTTNLYLDGIIKGNGEFLGNIIIRGLLPNCLQ